MVRIDPRNLNVPRVYFTDFDHRLVKRSRNITELKRKCERKLKALMLIKNQIVCAASHLTTGFAYDFFSEHSLLLTNKIMVPAFRSDMTDLKDLFERKRFKDRDSAIHFFSDHIQITVNWDLGENSMWFRDRFLIDIEDKESVVCQNLSKKAKAVVLKLADEIRASKLLNRELIDQVASDLPLSDKRILQNYRELLYHISGARVVNCESALPQENYIEYDITDPKQKRTRLSEEQILIKLFMEMLFDSLQKNLVSVTVLDKLSFEDISAIRQPILSSDFQVKYGDLLKKVIGSYTECNDKIFNISELENIRNSLSNSFNSVIGNEMIKYHQKKERDQIVSSICCACSLTLSLLGANSNLGVIASIASIVAFLKDSPSLLTNISQNYLTHLAVTNQNKYYQIKKGILLKNIKKLHFNNKYEFIEMANLLENILSCRIKN